MADRAGRVEEEEGAGGSGVGIDVVPVARAARLLAKWGDVVLDEVLSPAERGAVPRGRRRAEWFAGRIAAKEAVMKACGRGSSLGWHAVQIGVEKGGRPTAHLCEEGTGGGRAVRLSIAHDGGVALAMAVLMASGDILDPVTSGNGGVA